MVFEQINKLRISEFMYRFTHNFRMLFQVTFLIYLIFILTKLDPVKTYVAVLPEQIPVGYVFN